MNPDIDAYIRRTDKWPDEVAALRSVLLACGLTEEIKWNKPCYSHEGRNIAIMQEMNDFLALMFFKGALLKDPESVLVDQGPNSRSARRLEFTSVADVAARAKTVGAYVAEAIEVEDAGLEVGPPPELVLADELRQRLDGDPAMQAAFEALTPGRQREYNLYISGAKQSATRESRIDTYADKILEGKGFRDR
ncbi:MAG: YdeI/OmpD-associated family protein [Ilumatobacteraceae bacterium]